MIITEKLVKRMYDCGAKYDYTPKLECHKFSMDSSRSSYTLSIVLTNTSGVIKFAPDNNSHVEAEPIENCESALRLILEICKDNIKEDEILDLLNEKYL